MESSTTADGSTPRQAKRYVIAAFLKGGLI